MQTSPVSRRLSVAEILARRSSTGQLSVASRRSSGGHLSLEEHAEAHELLLAHLAETTPNSPPISDAAEDRLLDLFWASRHVQPNNTPVQHVQSIFILDRTHMSMRARDTTEPPEITIAQCCAELRNAPPERLRKEFQILKAGLEELDARPEKWNLHSLKNASEFAARSVSGWR